jgi:hypothetical protein
MSPPHECVRHNGLVEHLLMNGAGLAVHIVHQEVLAQGVWGGEISLVIGGVIAIFVIYELRHPCLRYSTRRVFVPLGPRELRRLLAGAACQP